MDADCVLFALYRNAGRIGEPLDCDGCVPFSGVQGMTNLGVRRNPPNVVRTRL